MIKLDGMYFSPLGAVDYIKSRYLRVKEVRTIEPSSLVDRTPVNKFDEINEGVRDNRNKL